MTGLGYKLLQPVAALAFVVLLIGGTPQVLAQQQGPSGSNPTAGSVTEEQLFQELNKLQGRITIPNREAATLHQPQGRDYQSFHEGLLPWISGIAVLGMILLLALVYFAKGPVRAEPAEKSGPRIQRFNAFERFTHWMTATCFILLAISGLNYIFGKRLLMPLIGPDAFSTWSQWAKYAHNFLSWPFMLGVLIMIAVWLRHNLPDRYDWPWLKAGGGLYNNRRPPAGHFNAGQKLVFWAVALGGIALAATGMMMLFPFSLLDINGMQLAQYIHATVGVLLIAVMIAHIYIGSIGMEGAFDAMGRGDVDLTWARHHHSAWVESRQPKGPPPKGPTAARTGRRSASPAE